MTRPAVLPDFRRLKEILTVGQVLQARGLMGPFRTRGARLIGPCPIHGGDNPSAFVTSHEGRSWYCFTRCARGGDIIDLVRSLDGCSYRRAGEHLAALASAAPQPSPCPSPSRPQAPHFVPFVRSLPLLHETPWLQAKGISPTTAAHFETGAALGNGWLHRCVAVRLHDPNDYPLGYAGRHLDRTDSGTAPKWRFPPALPKSRILFNFHRVRHDLSRGLAVTECPWGVMRLAQLHIPAVALLGVALSHTQIQLLSLAPRLVLVLDGDSAGRQATRHILATLQLTTDTRAILLPEGLDPDDLSDHALHCRVAPWFHS